MELRGPQIFSAGKWRDESIFCWLLEQPAYLPWFMSHVERWANAFDWRPTWGDVQTRVKWILLDQGLAATPYLAEKVNSNKGRWTSPVRTYRLPEPAEILEAFAQAIRELAA